MTRHAYYHTCPICGANLDPGERCDCEVPVSAPVAKQVSISSLQAARPRAAAFLLRSRERRAVNLRQQREEDPFEIAHRVF